MQMTAEEIRRSYRQAKRPKEQVNILAELNNCTAGKIREILVEEPPRLIKKEEKKTMSKTLINYDEVRRLYETGLSDVEIAAAVGARDRTYICKWRSKRGLPPNTKKPEVNEDIDESSLDAPTPVPPVRETTEENIICEKVIDGKVYTKLPAKNEASQTDFLNAMAALLTLHKPGDTPDVNKKYRELAIALLNQELDRRFG